MPLFLATAYLMMFTSVALFVFSALRVLREIQYVPVEEETWMEVSELEKNPLYRVMMMAARLLARVNVNLNLGVYEVFLKRKLDAAGRPWELKPTEYMALKQMSAIVVGVVGLVLHLSMATNRFPVFVTIFFCFLGYLLPNFFINRIIDKRKVSILLDLPFVCDLLTLSVEAGLDFGTALDKVVENGPPGPLRDELATIVQETRIGKTRREAFADMAERIQMQEISSFVGAINQAERMGTGFAPVLRIQSEQIRHGRFERAEKLAQKVPVKILFPIILVNLFSIALILIVPLLSAIGDVGI